MKRIFTLILAWMASASLTACAGPVSYSAEPIEARIVDADTKQPLDGVVVVAHWVLEGGMHVDRVGDLMILETVTDKNGRFAFPAWGPITHWKSSRLTNMDPEMLIFKSGYEYRVLTNPATKEAIEGKPFPVRRSVWNGKTIEMKVFKGGDVSYKDSFQDLNYRLERILAEEPKECYWKKTPRTIRAMNQERKRLIAQGINPHTLHTIDNELLMNDKFYTEKGGCGSPKAFFGDFQQ